MHSVITETVATARSIKEMLCDRSALHLSRKFYHLLMGIICIVLYAVLLTREQALKILFLIGGPMVVLDILRLISPKINFFTLEKLKWLMRKEEVQTLSGNSYFIFGLFFCAYFFSKPIAILSVLFLAVGDPIAGWFGNRFGKNKIFGGKSLEGFYANCAVCFLVAFLLCRFGLRLPQDRSFAMAWVGALSGGIAEVIPLPWNDNLTIPIFSGLSLTLCNSLL